MESPVKVTDSRFWTAEKRSQLSKTLKAVWKTPERRRAKNNRGFHHSKKTKERLRQCNLGIKPSIETLRKRSLALRGRRLTEKDKQKKSKAQKQHASLPLIGICGCYAHRWPEALEAARKALRKNPLPPTDIERFLVNRILVEFPEILTQEQFGCYHVDAYLPPPYHIAFEADGEYWHQNPKRDAARDFYLLRKFDLPVVRLTGQEILEVCNGKS